jgi:hypothetical protein
VLYCAALSDVQGNVILTDHSYQILTLLRSHRDDDKGRSTMARHPYPMHSIRLRQPLPLDTLKAALTAAAAATAAVQPDSADNNAAGQSEQQQHGSDSEAEADASEQQQQQQQQQSAAANGKQAAGGGKRGAGGKAGKAAAAAAAGPVLKSIVADLVPYGPAVAEHCCRLAGLQPQHPVAKQPLSGDQIVALHAAVQQFEAWLAALDQGAQAEGFITAVHTAASKAQQQQQQQQQDKAAGSAGGKDGLVYQEYNPLLLQGGKLGGEVITFPSFDDALDEYYGKVSTVASHQVVEHSDFSRERRGHVINDTPGGGGITVGNLHRRMVLALTPRSNVLLQQSHTVLEGGTLCPGSAG